MRRIHTHEINDLNRAIRIEADDDTAKSVAPCQYVMTRFTDIEIDGLKGWESGPSIFIGFHTGPFKAGEVPNGITNEVLLAIVADRLDAFQRGPFACPENRLAFAHVSAALAALKDRADARIARGVEGTHTV